MYGTTMKNIEDNLIQVNYKKKKGASFPPSHARVSRCTVQRL